MSGSLSSQTLHLLLQSPSPVPTSQLALTPRFCAPNSSRDQRLPLKAISGVCLWLKRVLMARSNPNRCSLNTMSAVSTSLPPPSPSKSGLPSPAQPSPLPASTSRARARVWMWRRELTGVGEEEVLRQCSGLSLSPSIAEDPTLTWHQAAIPGTPSCPKAHPDQPFSPSLYVWEKAPGKRRGYRLHAAIPSQGNPRALK